MNFYKFLFIWSLFISCSPINSQISEYDQVIGNVNVLDIDAGDFVEKQDVIIKGEKILKVIPAHDKSEYTADKYLDGTGKFLVPGISEMHAHIPNNANGNEELVKETLFLYLSNGITTIRGMLGHPFHLTLKSNLDSYLSPRIFTSSPSLNGNSIPDGKTAAKKVSEYAKAGYDFLKIHPGIKKVVFDSMVVAAKANNIKFSGHVPIDVGIRHAIKSKYASIDHLDGYMEGLVPSGLSIDPNSNGFFGFDFTDIVDKGRMNELSALSVKNKVWVVPTQTLITRWISPEDPQKMAQDPEMQYISGKTRFNWVSSKQRFINSDNYNKEKYEKFIGIKNYILKSLFDSGVGILLGSDAPQVFNVPGFSIQHEMQDMQDAGIPPIEIIRAGSVNPAQFFGMEDEFGKISENFSADLILLSYNPLVDIYNMSKISDIFVRGYRLNKEFIDSKLRMIAEKYAQE
jgi:hypothetical protein